MSTDPWSECVFVLRGRFAREVADRCAVPEACRLDVDGPVYAAQVPYAAALVSITAGRDRAFRDRLDSVAFLRSIPYVGLELLPTELVCGPAVVPGRTACYACYARRLEQHGRAGDELEASTSGLPEGYGPDHVAIGAGFLRTAVAEVAELVAERDNRSEGGGTVGTSGLGGTVRTLDLVTGGVRSFPTVAVNHCDRCGQRFRTDRAGAGAVAGLR